MKDVPALATGEFIINTGRKKMKTLKQVVKTTRMVYEDGKDVEQELVLAVLVPTAKIRQDAKLVHAKAYKDALEAGAMMREELESFLRKSKMWDDERQSEYDRLRKTLVEGERRLAKGGVRLKEARALAIQMSKDRLALQDLLSQRNRIDANTADAHADQVQFNFLVASCTVYNDSGKPYFTVDGEHVSVENYIDRGTESAALAAAGKLSEMLYGNERELLSRLPENEFLKKYNFIDADLHLIDDRGRRVDEKGRLVDEDGRFVNEQGEYVDADGNRVDEEGNFLVEFSPFLDDDDKPIGDGKKAEQPEPETDPEPSETDPSDVPEQKEQGEGKAA